MNLDKKLPFVRNASLVLALLPAGCVTHEIKKERVDQSVLEQHEVRLLEPYKRGFTVACQSLVIDANPVLMHNLALPAAQPEKRRLDDVEELTWSSSDRVKIRPTRNNAKPLAEPRMGKLTITIGTTAFIVDERVTVRRLMRAPPTLTAVATGHVMVIRDGKKAETFREVRFAEGRVDSR